MLCDIITNLPSVIVLNPFYMYFSSIVKSRRVKYRSWDKPVLSNDGKTILLKETTGAFDWVITKSWQEFTEEEPDALTYAPRISLVHWP